MRSTIICVDDEKVILSILNEQLISWFGTTYTIEKALSGEEALEILDGCMRRNREVSVVISDYIMPNMKGDELLTKVKERNPKIKTIMLTGYSSIEGIIKAINKAGLYRFISKPWDNKDLMLTILEAIKSYEQDRLTTSLARKYEALRLEYKSTVDGSTVSIDSIMEVLATTSDTRGLTSEGHSKRVAQYSSFLAKTLKMNEDELRILQHASLMHDVGKLTMSDEELATLRESKSLESKSRVNIRLKQIQNSEEILKPIINYEEVINAIRYQFEEYAGGGPLGLVGESIPIYSRILAITNEFDFLKNKLTADRLMLNEIVDALNDKSGILYDPSLLEKFIGIIRPEIKR